MLKNLEYRIGADFGEIRREAEKTGDSTRKFQKALRDMEQQQREHRQTLVDLGKGIATFGASIAAGLGIAVKAAIDWESAFTGVRKTVDGSDTEIAALEGELRNLARTLPTTHEEIAAVAEAAGQLGVKRKDIASFTKTMIDLGVSTNLTAEDAATALAKMSNIMGTSAADVDRMGSALVALGNDGASTEQDIIDMALRIAGAGKAINLTEAQVLGFASALSSVGIAAEAGGTAISTVMVQMAQKVREGGKGLDDLAKVAGTSSAEFSQRFKVDAAGAIVQFIQGLGKMQQTGGDVFGTLQNLGFEGGYVRDTLLRAAGASDVFSNSLRVGSQAYTENSALANEANKRYETSASRLAVAGNQIKDALIDVGATVAPVFAGMIQGISNLVLFWRNLPGPIREVVSWVGLAAAGLTLVGGAALIAAPKIMLFRESMDKMIATGGTGSTILGKFGKFMVGPWGAAIGLGVTLLTAFGIASGAAEREQADLASAGKTLADVIKEQNGELNQATRAAAAKAAEDGHLLESAESLHLKLSDVTSAILGEGDAYDKVKGKLQDIIDKGTERVTAGKGGSPTQYSDEALAAQDLLDKLNGLIGEKDKNAAADKRVADAAQGSAGAQKEHADASGKTATKLKEESDALDALIKGFNELNGITLTSREAQRNYAQTLADTAAVFERNGEGLDINTEKGRENSAALDAQAKAANDVAEASAREAEKTGGAAAGQEALLASLESSRPALIAMADAMGMTGEEAKAYADQVLGIPQPDPTFVKLEGSPEAIAEIRRVMDAINAVPPGKDVNVGVISEAARRELSAIQGIKVTTNSNGTVTVNATTQAARDTLNNFINSNNNRALNIRVNLIETYYQGKGGRYTAAQGGIVSYASGGIEDHRPQIVRGRPGMVRVWAEEETDKESYIPWARDRRRAAMGVLRTTASGFGYDLVPRSRSAASVHRSAGTGSSAVGQPASVVVELRSSGTRRDELLLDDLRHAIQVRGGNAQIVLGSS